MGAITDASARPSIEEAGEATSANLRRLEAPADLRASTAQSVPAEDGTHAAKEAIEEKVPMAEKMEEVAMAEQVEEDAKAARMGCRPTPR